METNEIQGKMPSMWEPISKRIDVALIGKTLEELSELIVELANLQNILSRALIQGLDGLDPATAISNRTKITQEIADVQAKLDQLVIDWQLDATDSAERRKRKFEFSGQWFDWLRNEPM
jgi:hypothetical protein